MDLSHPRERWIQDLNLHPLEATSQLFAACTDALRQHCWDPYWKSDGREEWACGAAQPGEQDWGWSRISLLLCCVLGSKPLRRWEAWNRPRGGQLTPPMNGSKRSPSWLTCAGVLATTISSPLFLQLIHQLSLCSWSQDLYCASKFPWMVPKGSGNSGSPETKKVV